MLNSEVTNRLNAIKATYTKISAALLEPDTIRDRNKFRTLAKQKSALEDLVAAYNKYLVILKKCQETEATAAEVPALHDLALDDLKYLRQELQNQEQQIKHFLLPKDLHDSKNIICEIKGAAGGDEANIFAGDLFRMYSKYAELQNWKIQVLDAKISESGGYSLIAFKIQGKNVYQHMKFEAGAHRVQRIPKTESKGRVHTSVATVAVLPEADEVVININPKDLRIDTYRSSGAGGQHVNKTDSAIRITHIPTGIVVTSQDGRSQHDNRALAMQHLNAKLDDLLRREQAANISSIRKEAVGKGDRSEKIRTYNYPQNRVTDHRLNKSWNKLNLIMEGQLEDIVTSLISYHQQMQMQKIDA